MPETPVDLTLSIIEQAAPKSILLCSPQQPQPLVDYCQHHQVELTIKKEPTTIERRYDIAIINQFLGESTSKSAIEYICSLRNLYTHQILFIDRDIHSGVLTDQDFIAMGFQRINPTQSEQEFRAYQYNLSCYNHKRTWNNARHWANPENWGKYWW